MAMKSISPEERFYQHARHVLETALSDINRAYLELMASRPNNPPLSRDTSLVDPRDGSKIKIGKKKKRGKHDQAAVYKLRV
jgi:hypothetical protein